MKASRSDSVPTEDTTLKKRNTLSVFLKEKRVAAGLTQSEVANKLGYSSPQFVSNWERGLANPPVFILKDLTKMYKVPVDEMFELLVGQVRSELHKEFYASKGRRRI
jgi:transcriptional regulator with XRE-family HTH domain